MLPSLNALTVLAGLWLVVLLGLDRQYGRAFELALSKRWIEPVRDALIPRKSSQSDTNQGGQSPMSTNRPMRQRQNLVLTVGPTEGDLQGKDDKVIQAGVEYLHRLGGGTLRILPLRDLRIVRAFSLATQAPETHGGAGRFLAWARRHPPTPP